MIVLSNGVSQVGASFASGPPGEARTPSRLSELFRYPFGPAVATFSLVSAAFHLLVVSPWGNRRYLAELSPRRNRFRWVESGRAVSWTPFVFGTISGSFPWIVLAVCVASAGSNVPTFVHGILVTIFVLFNCFAVNRWLQYRAVGRWRDYPFGERVYIWLSLVAKSLLAWQILDNVLVSTS